MESDAVQREIENNDVPYNNSRKTISISTDKLEDIDQYKKPSCSYKDISDSQTVNKPSVSVVNEQAFHIQDNVGKFSSRDEIQLKCMNCDGNLTQRRHKINFGVVEEMIRKWIAPQVIEKSTILCHSCWKLSFVDYNEPEMSEKTYYSDHRRVCKDDRSQFRTKPSTVPSNAHTQLSIRYTMIEWRKNKKATKTKSASLEGEDGLQRPSRSTSTPARASWACPLEFILACLGYAVGLGNVWRFPYLCYRNGGGAFLIPFFLMLIFIGLPIFYLELYIGQYTGMGPLKAFSSIAPFFSGLGYCTLVVITIIQIYYMIIVAWTLFYTFVSLGGHLGWGLCDNKYNTKFCYSGEYDHACRINNTGGANDLTYYLRQCMSIGEICIATGFQPYDHKYCLDGTEKVPWYSNVTRKLAAEEYYNERVLGRGDATWSNWGTIQWHLVGTLFLSWLTAFCCVIKGVQSAGKVVYFTALFPYVMLTALLIRGVTLEGAEEGILFYLAPNWGTLLEARVWGDAASQIFYSFGVACGSLVTLASYNNFHNNCHFDACFVSFANFGTSIYAGFAIFSVLGFQARQMGVSVDDVAEQGPGLAFVAYPEALLQMPVPQFWSIMFFFMLFILGLGSQFAGIEAINTAIVDRWPHLRKNYWKITAFTCLSCFILGLPMCFSGGVYLFTLLDWNTASWAILILGMAESASVSWCYGIKRAMRDLETMGMTFNKFLRFYWTLVWTVIVPFGSIGILIFIFKDWQSPEFEGYVFPVFAELLGWCVGLSTLVLLPVGVAWAYYYGYRGKALFSPTPSWKAAKKTTNEPSDPSIKPPAIILNPL